MGTILTIALRNIARHKRRTVLSALTIAIGLMIYIFMDSIMSGMDRGAIDNMIALSTSSLKIHTKAYEKDKESVPLKHGIPDYRKVMAALKRRERVRGVTRRTIFRGQLSNFSETIPVMGTIVDPQSDTTVFSVKKYLKGNYYSADSKNEIILGGDLAHDLGLAIGDFVTLYGLTRYDSRNADEFKIIATLHTTDPGLNRSSVVISYAAANEFLDLENLVTEINCSMERRTNIQDLLADQEDLKKEVQKEFDTLVALTLQDINGAFLEISRLKRKFGIGFMFLIVLIAAVGIFNTVLMSVYERIREVGVMRAFGFRKGEITLLFTLEAFITGLIGSFTGLLCGSAVNLYLVNVGYPIDKIAGDIDTAGFPVWGTIYGEWNGGTLLFAALLGITMATIAGIIPARKASHLQITQSLRFD